MRRTKKIDRRVPYRGTKWHVRAVRPNWLIIEKDVGLRTHERLWIPRACVSEDDIDRAVAA